MANKIVNDSEQEFFRSFLSRVHNAPFLSGDEEIALVRRIKAGGADGERARGELATAYLRLVTSVACKTNRRGRNLQEIMQEGTIGLMLAVDRFEEERGVRFGTYAWWWIRASIKDYLNKGDGTIYIPANQGKKVARFVLTVKRLGEQLLPVTEENLASEMGISVEEVRDIAETRMINFMASINDRVGEDGRLEVGDLIADRLAVDAEQNLISEENAEHVVDALGGLSERERKIVSMRFGLNGESESTLEQVGNVFGVSKERIRQIEAKALSRLKKKVTR